MLTILVSDCDKDLGSEGVEASLTPLFLIYSMKNKRLKTIWARMKDRCYNQKHISYKYYGSRGIIICDQWLNSFEVFFNWAIANGYDDELTLDRKNGNGNYEPDNCRWATKKKQQANRRDNVKRDFNGQMLNAGEISDITGKSYMAEYLKTRRLNKKSA